MNQTEVSGSTAHSNRNNTNDEPEVKVILMIPKADSDTKQFVVFVPESVVDEMEAKKAAAQDSALTALYSHDFNIRTWKIALNQCPLDRTEDRVDLMLVLANAMSERHMMSKDIEDLDTAFSLRLQSMELIPPDHPSRVGGLRSLSRLALRRYAEAKEKGDVEGLIKLCVQTLSCHAPTHPDHEATLYCFIQTLRIRQHYRNGGGESVDAAVNEIISEYMGVLARIPSGCPDRASVLDIMATAMKHEFPFYTRGSPQEWNMIIRLTTEASSLRPLGHPNHEESLNNLSKELRARYRLAGTIDDLEKAISLLSQVLALRPPGHPDRCITLSSLAAALGDRCRRRHTNSRAGDSKLRSGVASPPASGSLISTDSDDWPLELHGVVQMHEEALGLIPSGDRRRAAALRDFASTMNNQYKLTNERGDLNRVIDLRFQALELISPKSTARGEVLLELAHAMCWRHSLLGPQNKFQSSMIKVLEETLEYTPYGHNERGLVLHKLSTALLDYYGPGKRDIFDRVIQLGTEALDTSSANSPERAEFLAGLAQAYSMKGARSEADFQRSKELLQEALRLKFAGEHSERLLAIVDRAADIRQKMDQSQASDYTQEALQEEINLASELLQFSPAGIGHDMDRVKCLETLAQALFVRWKDYEQHEGPPPPHSTISQVVQLRKECIKLCPTGHPHSAKAFHNFAWNLSVYFTSASIDYEVLRLIVDGPPHFSTLFSDLRQAKSWLLKQTERIYRYGATQEVPSMYSLRCAISCVWMAQGAQDEQSLEQAYLQAIQSLRRYLTIGPTVKHQYDALAEDNDALTSIPMDAAAHALKNGRVEKAMEVLEDGRSLLWSELRRFREPLHQAVRAAIGHELATTFDEICHHLQTLSTAETQQAVNLIEDWQGKLHTNSSSSTGMQYEKLIPQHQKLIQEHARVLSEIRQQPGLEDFQLPKSYDKLRLAAKEGPVIVVNCSENGSHAVIVFYHQQPIVIPLDERDHPRYFFDAMSQVHKQFLDARDLDPTAFNRKLYHILKELWRLVVEKVVDTLLTTSTTPRESRVWWCLTSFLTILPFHAAGNQTVRFVDFYKSSYTPTLQALIDARDLPLSTASPASATFQKPPDDPLAVLTVAYTKAQEGLKALPSGDEEVRVLQRLGPFVDTLEGERATSTSVLKELASHTWAHFICHGSVAASPFKSALHLHNGNHLTLDAIIRARLPNAQFAFLSACHTAQQRSKLQDETLHLAAAMQFIGFRSVVGTMWGMVDSDGPKVAKAVYTDMLVDGFWARASRMVLRLFRGRREGQTMFLPTFLVQLLRRWGRLSEGGKVVPRHERAAEAIWKVTQQMRRDGVALERWVNFIHIGA